MLYGVFKPAQSDQVNIIWELLMGVMPPALGTFSQDLCVCVEVLLLTFAGLESTKKNLFTESFLSVGANVGQLCSA